MYRSMRPTLISLITLLFILLGSQLLALPTSYLWAVRNVPFSIASATQNDQAVDSQGNVYIIGSYTSLIFFGGVASPSLSGGNSGAYIVKIAPNGIFLWAQYVTATTAGGAAIAVDNDQNVFIACSFSGAASFSSDPNNVGTITGGSAFLAKLNSQGNPVVIRVGTSVSTSLGITNNRLEAAGSFVSSVNYGPGTTTHTAQGAGFFLYRFNLFLDSLDSIASVGSTSSASKARIATNANDVTCFSGVFVGSMTFNGLPLITTTSTEQSSFVAKFVGLQVQYVRLISSTQYAQTGTVDVDAAGNCYVAGQFKSSITIDGQTRVSGPTYAYFVSKLDSSAIPIYLTVSQGISSATPVDLSCTDGGVCYFTAALDSSGASTANFIFGNYIHQYASSRQFNLMVARLDKTGNVEYIVSGTSSAEGGLNYGITINADNNGNVVVGGGLRGELIFGTLTLPFLSISATNNFVLKFTDTLPSRCGQCQAPTADCCELANGDGICYNSNVHTCTPQGVLCPVGHSSCADACYRPEQYTCYSDGFLCPANHERCRFACFLPSKYVCLPGDFLCPAGHLRCGRACYLPSQYDCVNNNVLKPI